MYREPLQQDSVNVQGKYRQDQKITVNAGTLEYLQPMIPAIRLEVHHYVRTALI